MRTEENRLAGKDGLDGILSAARSQAFADKDDGSDGIPMLQLPGGIEKETVGRRTADAAGFAAQGNFQAELLESSANFRDAFHMTGRDNQSEGGEVRAEPLKNFTEDLFFAGMRASAEKNGTIAIDPEAGEKFERQVGIQPYLGRIIFDAADIVNALARDAETHPALDVVRLLNANGIKTPKGRRD